jgi:uncharacterized integral membrane protein (TIGR00697 family)
LFNLQAIDRSLLWKLVCFHTFVIALSNYLVTIKFSMFGLPLTWAAFTFPLIVVATDLTIRLVNKENARAIVSAAFVPAIIASIAVVYLSGAPSSVAWRIGLASGVAYLFSNLMDVFVFQKVRERLQMWFWAPAISAVFANIVDTFVFFAVAFYNSANAYMAANWHILALNQTGAKVLVSAAVILPIYGVLLAWLQTRVERDIMGPTGS